jgi:hypothetical protein
LKCGVRKGSGFKFLFFEIFDKLIANKLLCICDQNFSFVN